MATPTGETPPLSQLLEVIREDWETHGRDWTRPGFRAVAVYRLGRWHKGFRGQTLGVRVTRKMLRLLHRSLYRFVRNHYGINLPHTARVGRRLRILNQGGIVIHEKAIIGDDCLIRQGVTIGAAADFKGEAPPRIGSDVDIGVSAMILGPISVGDGARIGPGAVVMKDVPPGATAFADPARVIFPPEVGDQVNPSSSHARDA